MSDAHEDAVSGIDVQRSSHPAASRAFRLIWLGLVVSLLGDQFYRVALTIVVAGQGAAALTSLGLVLALPAVIFGLFSGVLIDRSNKFRLLVATDLIRAVIVGALSFLLFISHPGLWLILVLAAALALVSVLFSPALQALMPELSKDKSDIISMDAWILGAIGVVATVGPALAGVLLSAFSAQTLMWLDAVSFLWSAAMVFVARRLLSAARSPGSDNRSGGARTMRAQIGAALEGVRFLMGSPILRACFTTFPVMEFAVYSVPFILPLLLVGGSAQHTAGVYGISLAALGAGRFGGLTAVNRSRLKNYRGWILRINFLVQGAAIVTLAGWPGPVVSVATLAVVGVASGTAQIAMSSYVQLEVPAEMRGRVFSGIISLTSGLQPFGAVLFGTIATFASPRIAFLLIGLILLAGGARLFGSRPLAQVR